jgi:DNA-binding NarL/FixJ family response regulator
MAQATANSAWGTVAGERARIALELHVVAHAVSIMVMQAAAADELLDTDPDRAQATLGAVQQAGRSAVAELARMLDLLRDARDDELAPLPTLDALPALAEEARRAGADVTISGDHVGQLAPAVQLCAYRVVQEALTNAGKHAIKPQVHVALERTDSDLVVLVEDDGGTGPVPPRARVMGCSGTKSGSSSSGALWKQRLGRAWRFPGPRRIALGEIVMTTVLIVDDEELFRSGLRMVLDSRPGVEVLGEAASGAEAVAAVQEHSQDVVLMDIQMPKVNGIDATRQIVRMGLPTRVLMLTTFGMDRYVVESLRPDASGFLLKTVPPAELVAGIEVVARGEALLAPRSRAACSQSGSPARSRMSSTPGLRRSPIESAACCASLARDCPTRSLRRISTCRGNCEGPRQPHPRQDTVPRSRAGRRARL